jgi:hypothetical protein
MIKDRDITLQVIDGASQVPASLAAPRLTSQWYKDIDGRLVMRWELELEVDEQLLLDALAA